MSKKVRKVGDHEISPYQGTGGQKQMLRAQARKRRQIRNGERFDETFGPWVWLVVVGIIVVMGITAFSIEASR